VAVDCILITLSLNLLQGSLYLSKLLIVTKLYIYMYLYVLYVKPNHSHLKFKKKKSKKFRKMLVIYNK